MICRYDTSTWISWAIEYVWPIVGFTRQQSTTRLARPLAHAPSAEHAFWIQFWDNRSDGRFDEFVIVWRKPKCNTTAILAESPTNQSTTTTLTPKMSSKEG